MNPIEKQLECLIAWRDFYHINQRLPERDKAAQQIDDLIKENDL